MAWAAGTSFISCPFLLLGRISWLMPNPQASSRSSTHPICEEVNTICQKHKHRRFQRAPGAQVCVDKAWEISQWCHLLWAGAVPAAVPVLCWESPLTAPSPALCHSLAPQNQLWQSPACQLCCSEHTQQGCSPLVLCWSSAESFDLSKPAEIQNISVIVCRTPSSDREQSPT